MTLFSFKRLAKRSRRFLMRLPRSTWPTPPHSSTSDPLFYFLLTPSNSGSTAIADFFCQLAHVTGLNAKYEGQWLVPGLSRSDRWESAKPVNYDSVRATWIAEYEHIRSVNPTITALFEKSPPNLVRYQELKQIFPHSVFVASNRDPYANISSRLHRYYYNFTGSREQRRDMIDSLIRRWIETSSIIKQLVEIKQIPLLTYERFCESPQEIFRAFGFATTGSQFDKDFKVRVKEYQPQGIVNMNETQVGKIDEDDIARISLNLKDHVELLEFFDYGIRL